MPVYRRLTGDGRFTLGGDLVVVGVGFSIAAAFVEGAASFEGDYVLSGFLA
ncbi:MAG: hypothetical protein JSS43_08525 [Proteobacteria bacterium]|nr:hypothetical protein [Pseudomonadota bacterium]